MLRHLASMIELATVACNELAPASAAMTVSGGRFTLHCHVRLHIATLLHFQTDTLLHFHMPRCHLAHMLVCLRPPITCRYRFYWLINLVLVVYFAVTSTRTFDWPTNKKTFDWPTLSALPWSVLCVASKQRPTSTRPKNKGGVGPASPSYYTLHKI